MARTAAIGLEDASAERFEATQDLLERTATLPAKQVSALVGRGDKGGWVTHWRTELGVRGRSRTVRAERREQQQTAAVAGWPDGVQPTRDDGSLLCRVCGRW